WEGIHYRNRRRCWFASRPHRQHSGCSSQGCCSADQNEPASFAPIAIRDTLGNRQRTPAGDRLRGSRRNGQRAKVLMQLVVPRAVGAFGKMRLGSFARLQGKLVKLLSIQKSGKFLALHDALLGRGVAPDTVPCWSSRKRAKLQR